MLYLFSRSCGFIHNTFGMTLYTDSIRTLLDMSRTVSIRSRTLPRLAHTLSRLIRTRYTYFVLWTIHIVNANEWTNKNIVVRTLDEFEIVTELRPNPVVIWTTDSVSLPTRFAQMGASLVSMVFVQFCGTTLGSENGYAMAFVCYEQF